MQTERRNPERPGLLRRELRLLECSSTSCSLHLLHALHLQVLRMACLLAGLLAG
jgi:hypothetical protein